ncbi:MAG: helical backbone metal receptor [Candidatus Cloacimonetes bacterium]|nr:helical backbone metal receptor [Candidatus Cloacimonadota bacterium]
MKYLVLLVIFILLISCSQERERSEEDRYVITSPEVGEIFYLLQGVKNVVGVTEEVDYPADFKEIPKVGNFGAVSREKIIALDPTIVFTSGLEQEHLSFELEKAGIKTVSIYPQSINEFLVSIEEIAKYLKIEEKGKEIADSLRNEIDNLRYLDKERPSVYLEIYGNPIMSVSRYSFIGEIVELAGGTNIFDELPRDYSRVRAEDVIMADPDIIILTYPGITAEDVRSRKGWQNIKACQDGRIYTIEDIDPDIILRASPRIIEGIKKLQEIFFDV